MSPTTISFNKNHRGKMSTPLTPYPDTYIKGFGIPFVGYFRPKFRSIRLR